MAFGSIVAAATVALALLYRVIAYQIMATTKSLMQSIVAFSTP